MMNIAIKNGIALDRWCKSVTVMIEKDTSVPAIHRLRIIHLYEADYNLFLKLQWELHLVRHNEKHHGLKDQQFGSRKKTRWLWTLFFSNSFPMISVVNVVLTLPPLTTTPPLASTAASLWILLCWRRDVFACQGM
jgi:hypothetical protein